MRERERERERNTKDLHLRGLCRKGAVLSSYDLFHVQCYCIYICVDGGIMIIE